MTDSQVAEAIRLYGQGLSLDKVGQRLGFSASCVCRSLRDAGFQTRDRHGHVRSN